MASNVDHIVETQPIVDDDHELREAAAERDRNIIYFQTEDAPQYWEDDLDSDYEVS
jgi:hypothetical protein